MGLNAREADLRRNYMGPNGEYTPPPIKGTIAGQSVSTPHVLLMNGSRGNGGRDGRVFVSDVLFPARLEGKVDTACIDEGSADLLYGLVRAMQPLVCLETGTHKGRSTRAIAAALFANSRTVIAPLTYTTHFTPGVVYTVDADDHRILTSGAIPEAHRDLVRVVTGWTPDVFTQEPLASLTGIEFAFLDGDHTAEGLDAELTYVDQHRAPECWVAIDNSRDDGWPQVRRLLASYKKYPRLSLSTCTGLDLIHMADAVARSPRAETRDARPGERA
jgi:hypothetical protein